MKELLKMTGYLELATISVKWVRFKVVTRCPRGRRQMEVKCQFSVLLIPIKEGP